MRWLLWIAIAIACAGCDPLVGGDYAGEPLLRLQGVVSSTRGSNVVATGARGAALWQSANLWGVTDFTRLPLRVEFPAFSIDILALPGDRALFQVDPAEPAIAEAYLHIVKPDTAAMARGDDFLATDYEHVLVYVSGPLAPTGMTASYLGGALAPGFHVVTRTAITELTAPQQALAARCIALATAGPAGRAEASCAALHAYRLDPTPDDAETVLRFRMELPDA